MCEKLFLYIFFENCCYFHYYITNIIFCSLIKWNLHEIYMSGRWFLWYNYLFKQVTMKSTFKPIKFSLRFFLFLKTRKKTKTTKTSALKKNRTKCDLYFPTFCCFFFSFSSEHYQNHNLLPLNKTPMKMFHFSWKNTFVI